MMEKKLGNYANVKYYCISNGDGIGVSIYLSGCHFHCKGCQNSSIWNYDAGNELTYDVIKKIIRHMASNKHVNHLSILGGEPLDKKNLFFFGNLSNKPFCCCFFSQKFWERHTFSSPFSRCCLQPCFFVRTQYV